jgi:branched-subunit amino acid ABC-type transport system permease component
MDLGGWLRSLGLDQYAATFRANEIDTDVRDFALPLWAAGTLGALGTGIIAVVCDTAVLMPLRRAKAPELASLIVTLGGVLLLNSVMFLIFGAAYFPSRIQLPSA